MDRFPLRLSQRLQLGEWIGRDGARAVIRACRVSREELDQVVAGKVPPTVSDRAKLIVGLMRAGYSQGRGDPHGPGVGPGAGFEHIAGVDYAEQLEREQARADRRERRERRDASRGV